jgi:hypothetical protein
VRRKLTELRVCDNCSGPVGLIFQVIRVSIAVVNPKAVQEFLGMHQFFGGQAHANLVMNFAPAADQAITIAMDEDEYASLTTELFVCMSCFALRVDLPVLVERVNKRNEAANVQSADGRSTTAVKD